MTTPASPYLSEPLILDHRALQNRASARGTSFETELAEFLTANTGNVKPDALSKLDQRQAKLEDQIASLEAERGRALGVAAEFHQLTQEHARLSERLGHARAKLALHRSSAFESMESAKQYIGDHGNPWPLCGNLLWDSLAQTQIADAMAPLVDALAAEVAAKSAEVLGYARANGITPTAQPKG